MDRMKQKALVVPLLIITLLGLADSWYLAEKALTGGTLTCNISGLEGCNVVAQSVYSHLFGIPLGVYGVVFYGVVFILSALLLIEPKRFIHSTLAVLGTIGLLASIVFLGIQFFLIKALCVYCLGSAVVSLLVFVVTVWLWKRSASAPVSIP
jgi:uncharacterized membrane protein